MFNNAEARMICNFHGFRVFFRREEVIRQLDTDLQQERSMTDTLISDMVRL